MTRVTPEDIDAVLPQTQCGLCGHGGCMPYAEAIIYEKAELNLCPPGGVPVLKRLGEIMSADVTQWIDDMAKKAKPELVAVIREDECIGCTKCIQVCPVDSILGGAKKMHTVIADECSGCELCVPACPVDCIDLVEITHENNRADQYRERFQARNARLSKTKAPEKPTLLDKTPDERKKYIQAVLQRKQGAKITA